MCPIERREREKTYIKQIFLGRLQEKERKSCDIFSYSWKLLGPIIQSPGRHVRKEEADPKLEAQREKGYITIFS